MQTTQELRREQEPLEAATREYARLKEKLRTYKKDKLALQERKQELAMLTAQLESLSWEHEVLQQRFAQVATAGTGGLAQQRGRV